MASAYQRMHWAESGMSMRELCEDVAGGLRDGRQIKGIRKNEDSFSIQIMDTNEQLSTFLKKDLRDVIDEKKSLMPDYGPDKLTEAEIDDLLAYLRTLHGR